jgi:hypothetical protein
MTTFFLIFANTMHFSSLEREREKKTRIKKLSELHHVGDNNYHERDNETLQMSP